MDQEIGWAAGVSVVTLDAANLLSLPLFVCQVFLSPSVLRTEPQLLVHAYATDALLNSTISYHFGAGVGNF